MKFSRLFYSIFFVLLFAGVLSAQEGKPILTDIKFLINGLAVETTSYEDIRVKLILNEQMDQTLSPTVKFGLSSPFGFNVPSEGQGWITNTLWQGLFTISDANPNDDDGEYNFQIYGAKDSEGTVMDTTLSSNLGETLYICRSGKVALSTTTIDFGTIRIGTDKILSFILSNESCADLIVNSISVTPPFYLYESPFQFGLSANSARQMSVWFVPTARTTYNGTLTINSNDRQQNQHTIQLTGTATGPKIVLVPGTPINFGKVEIGEDSTRSFYIKNAKADNPDLTDTLAVNNILASHNVYQASPTSFDVAPGDTQQVDVTFTPLQKISYNNQTLQI